MCGGGNRGPSREETERRHQEQMELQREQMRIQQEQFEKNLELQRERFEAQRATASATPPPAPQEGAEVAASAVEAAPATPTAVADPTVNPDNQSAAANAATMLGIGTTATPRTRRSGTGRRRFRTDLAGGSGGLSIPGY